MSTEPLPLSAETGERLLRGMMRVRAFEEAAHDLYQRKLLPGMSPHLSVGQEAVSAGVCLALRPDDYMITTHRGHGHCLMKSMDPRRMMAELCSKETGYCHGRGGSMHIASPEVGALGANGIVGAGLPIAVGAGISIQYRGTDQVCVVFFGDGASNQGTFHESLNFAAARKLPLVFACENNLYALSTLYERMGATPNVADRAKGYDIPGVVVNGMDVEGVHRATLEAVARARAGEGPTLLEAKTYRYYGHGASDHRPYRTREEEAQWRCVDAIDCYRDLLAQRGLCTAEQMEAWQAEALAEAADAVEFTLASPDPDPAHAGDYMFV
jgi:TPP-dependent pyruvate/acetoin dehydrogenase alpha subunit